MKVIYEDETLVVIDKPAGLVVHPGAGTTEPTLIDLLEDERPELQGLERSGLVHRLDKGTSGIVVIAKTPAAKAALSAQFADRKVQKRYQALVDGVPGESEATIDAPITRHHADRTRMTVRPDGKAAETRYQIDRVVGGRALLDVYPKTGRTHQIRVHLAALGTPITGDATYGTANPDLDRPFLHAAGLELEHPVSGQRAEFTAPLPPELTDFLESHE
jgi:23S rRNA pseudouridine1911/1915/1917 synthase